jgi:hypothetical protein
MICHPFDEENPKRASQRYLLEGSIVRKIKKIGLGPQGI